MPWVFEHITGVAPTAEATICLDRWRERGGLLVWEDLTIDSGEIGAPSIVIAA
jgi:hypothetical protein